MPTTSSPLNPPSFTRLVNVPGRETAAGRALFALYNGYAQARQRGNHFSDINRTYMRRRPPQSPNPPPEARAVRSPSQKFHVKVPRFRRLQPVDSKPQVTSDGRGKRKASVILKQLKEDLAHMELPPHPTRPVLDDKEKERLAILFEWSGRLDKEELFELPNKSQLTTGTARKKFVKGSIEEQEMLLDKIAEEIEERERFIRDMEKLGLAHKYRNQIRWEIEQRLKQMEKLDNLINQEVQQILQSQESPQSR